jgi:hypothetical protein
MPITNSAQISVFLDLNTVSREINKSKLDYSSLNLEFTQVFALSLFRSCDDWKTKPSEYFDL